MTTAITPSNPLAYNFTEAQLAKDGGRPLLIGQTLNWRVQYRDSSNAAVSLTGYTGAKFTIRTAAGTTYTRTLSIAISGAAPAANEIAFDSDQVNEDTVNLTGKGWTQINFAATAAEVTAQTAVAGRNLDYDYVLKAPDGTETAILRGKIDVLTTSTSMPI